MSMAGTPKARARKAYTQAVAAARAEFFRRIEPAQREYARAIRPHQAWLREQMRAAEREFQDARDPNREGRQAA